MAFAQHQMGQFVAIGAREHEMQPAALLVTALVELVPGSFEREHRVDTRIAGQCVLRFVYHQHDGFLRNAVEQLQGLGQRGADRQLRLAEIPGQGTQKAELLDPDILGQLTNALFIGNQRSSYGAGDQLGGVLFLVGPQIHVHGQPARS